MINKKDYHQKYQNRSLHEEKENQNVFGCVYMCM